MDDRGAVLAVIDRKAEIRRIKIKTLSPDKNMAQLAADIVEKCKYIHPSRTEEIEQLLIKLRKHVLSTGNNTSAPSGVQVQQVPNMERGDEEYTTGDRKRSDSRGRANGGKREVSDRDRDRDRERERRTASADDYGAPQREREKPPKKPVDNLPPADMNELDEYLEMLYQVSGKSDKEKEEGLRAQERGTAMILKLCRDVMNLEQLIQNSTVMGAITRVLQEEYKKSLDLTFNILRIFLAFSNFMEMHSLMANYRIGVLTMKVMTSYMIIDTG